MPANVKPARRTSQTIAGFLPYACVLARDAVRPTLPAMHVETDEPNVAARAPVVRLVDEVIDRYVDWREECAEVSAAYARWSGAGSGTPEALFAAYSASLDREQVAAELYAVSIVRLARFLWAEPEPDRLDERRVSRGRGDPMVCAECRRQGDW
jgi:hypothetical protein